MSDIRFQTAGEARWYVAYLRFLSGQRDREPGGNTYGYITRPRKAVLRGDALKLVKDLAEALGQPMEDQTQPSGAPLSPLIARLQQEGRW